MAKPRLGVIGAGSWTVASHLPALLEHADEIEFTAVNRRGADTLDRIRQRFGFAHAFEDYRDVLDAGVDLCVVASPTGHHHEHAKAALQAGAHVLLEKPMTIDPADAWDLVDTARRHDRHLLIAFGWNYRPMVAEFKELLDRHGIGTVEHLSVHMASVTRELLSRRGAYAGSAEDTVPEPDTWTDPKLSGGGYAQAQLSHALGLALWLTGLRGAQAFAFTAAPLDAPVELHDAIALRFGNGAVGSVAGGSCHTGAGDNKHQLEVRAIGSDGQIHLDVEREYAWLWRQDTDIRLPVQPEDGRYDCKGPIDTLVALAQGRDVPNRSPGELGARTVEILDAVYRSAASGKPESCRS
ncbi:Gfo/Idh/MocA family protein [Spongiactinospora sp. 9N601]|uniref:Gfo/Idh/MocA family protein n=1 Tax=Spongiactinospora sp. 9N601 TaxID=3375149 RepID=UPI0037965BFE